MRRRAECAAWLVAAAAAFALAAAAQPAPAQAQKLSVPAAAKKGLEALYAGNPDAAIANFRKVEKSDPSSPLGYLLEANADWWKIYCETLEVNYGMVDAWKRGKRPGDAAYFALNKKAIALAKAQSAKGDSALGHFYAGMGYALEARLYGLRDERSPAVHAGVAARKELRRAIEHDPGLADADTGLGLYNYYAATLSPLLKFLRFFAGIPGGNKKEGIRQLRRAMAEGKLTAVEARFYLAKNLRTYDHQYAEALAVLEPLVRRYPHNAIFRLLEGNLYSELGRTKQARSDYRAAEQDPIADAACAARVRRVAAALDALAR
jgi:tetratricopeptide (TPR) repeat protein